MFFRSSRYYYLLRGWQTLPEIEITSFQHPLVKEYNRLSASRRYRLQTGKLALEGPNLIEEALRASLFPDAVFYTRSYLEKTGRPEVISGLPAAVKRYLVTPAVFKKIAFTEGPQEIAALLPFRPAPLRQPLAERVELGLLLDRIRDPGNLGTIMRTAAATGATVYYTAGTVDPYSPKVLRATAGAIFQRPPFYLPAPPAWLDELSRQGVKIVTGSPAGERSYFEADYLSPTLFIIGNESRGVAWEIAAKAHQMVTIPQPGWGGSLNAAVAAALLLYEALRQRR